MKVKYGLKNAYYAVATINQTTGAATYGTPKRLPGAVSCSFEPAGEQNTFYADDIAYFTTGGAQGYTGSLELAMIPEDFLKDCLGQDGTTETGVLIELGDFVPANFALMFEFTTDDKALRHVFYNCVASRPTLEGQTKADSTEVKTETINLTCSSVYNAVLDDQICKARAGKTADPYDDWYEAVWQPTPPTPGP